MIQTDDRDWSAYAGLGQAELAMENYLDARAALQKALEVNPAAGETIKAQLDLTDRVLALDPNARGLRAAARYQRSNELLQAEVMRFDRCQPGNTASDAARKALTNQPRGGALEDSADMNLALAEDLWKQEQKLCGTPHAPNPNDQAIERVLARLSRQ
jgi:tetratricopeptide (TPR) repeat protein